MAAIEINKELERRGIDGWVALQIHDQLVVNVPEDRAEECRELVQDIMENNYKLSLDLKAPAELGKNLYEAH
jgi:DNA polymerase-1